MISRAFIVLIMMTLINPATPCDKKLSSGTHKLVHPFSMEIDPMKRLLIINFEKNQDSVYIGFEPQVFNDSINGSGHIIVAWRSDKKVDVYHQKTLTLNPEKYNIAGNGLKNMIATDLEIAQFEINDFGVQAHYKFKDLMGREIEIIVSENNPGKRKPFGILAPLGDAVTNPTSLPLIFLHDFYFVRKKHTDILVTINNKPINLEELPIRIDGQKMYFARYCPKPVIAMLNPDYNGRIYSVDLETNQTKFENETYMLEIDWSRNKPALRSVNVKNEVHPLKLNFNPAFPDLDSFPVNSSQKGSFIISGHPSVGSITGEYIIKSDNESVDVVLIPVKGWKPKTTKLSTGFLFTVSKVFKKWPTTYKWEASLLKDSDSRWTMRSHWLRTDRIIKD